MASLNSGKTGSGTLLRTGVTWNCTQGHHTWWAQYDLNTTITVHTINTHTHTQTHTVNTIQALTLFHLLTSITEWIWYRTPCIYSGVARMPNTEYLRSTNPLKSYHVYRCILSSMHDLSPTTFSFDSNANVICCKMERSVCQCDQSCTAFSVPHIYVDCLLVAHIIARGFILSFHFMLNILALRLL